MKGHCVQTDVYCVPVDVIARCVAAVAGRRAVCGGVRRRRRQRRRRRRAPAGQWRAPARRPARVPTPSSPVGLCPFG